jgi:hypothetical protein
MRWDKSFWPAKSSMRIRRETFILRWRFRRRARSRRFGPDRGRSWIIPRRIFTIWRRPRFTNGELIQCLKVVSDNRQLPAEQLQPKQAIELIAAQLPVLEQLAAELSRLRNSLASPQSGQLQVLLDGFHFTAAERQQLKTQLLRWECLTEGRALEVEKGNFRNGKEVLLWLARQLDAVGYGL